VVMAVLRPLILEFETLGQRKYVAMSAN